MKHDLNALAERLHALAANNGKGRTLVGIVGAPGAGKSTLAEALARKTGAVWLPMDGYHLSNRQLRALRRAERKGAPDTFDAAGFTHLLDRVRNQPGEEIFAPEFDRSIDESIAAQIRIGPEDRLVVVEGNYLLLDSDGWAGVGPLLHESWYVEPPASLTIERLVSRHRRFGRTEEEARAWVRDVDSHNAAAIAVTRQRADLVITDWGASN